MPRDYARGAPRLGQSFVIVAAGELQWHVVDQVKVSLDRVKSRGHSNPSPAPRPMRVMVTTAVIISYMTIIIGGSCRSRGRRVLVWPCLWNHHHDNSSQKLLLRFNQQDNLAPEGRLAVRCCVIVVCGYLLFSCALLDHFCLVAEVAGHLVSTTACGHLLAWHGYSMRMRTHTC